MSSISGPTNKNPLQGQTIKTTRIVWFTGIEDVKTDNILAICQEGYKVKYKRNNMGSATVEATLILPLFMFGMMVIYCMIQSILAENVLYRAAVETAEYLAETAYINENSIYAPELVFSNYVADEELLEKYIDGGVDGINFFGTTKPDEDGYFILQVNYTKEVSLPFMPKLEKDKTIYLKQRAYTGAIVTGDDEAQKGERYVFITDNKEAYHSTRLCTYLKLSVHKVNKNSAVAAGYTACEFCGDGTGEIVIITDYGGRYHFKSDCSGLKRTIYRVKIDEVGGMAECSRCWD